jgi:hypothetical protein
MAEPFAKEQRDLHLINSVPTAISTSRNFRSYTQQIRYHLVRLRSGTSMGASPEIHRGRTLHSRPLKGKESCAGSADGGGSASSRASA